MNNNLTQLGQDTVVNTLVVIEKKIEELHKELVRLTERRDRIAVSVNCEHELTVEGGIQCMVTTCLKCNFTWYD